MSSLFFKFLLPADGKTYGSIISYLKSICYGSGRETDPPRKYEPFESICADKCLFKRFERAQMALLEMREDLTFVGLEGFFFVSRH